MKWRNLIKAEPIAFLLPSAITELAMYVYLIEEKQLDSEQSGPWTKIGYSKNQPEWRIKANLRHGNPRELHLAAFFFFLSESSAYAAEQKAHNHFAYCLRQREWFNISWQAVDDWIKINIDFVCRS